MAIQYRGYRQMTIAKKIVGAAVASVTLASLCFGGEMNYSWKGYPSTAKTPSEAKLLIERRVPNTVRPNEEYSYSIKITNRSHYKLDEIALTEKLPPGFKFVRAVPSPKLNKVRRELQWNFGFLMPQQKVIITITGKAVKPGKIVHKGSANLIFHLGQMNAIMEVVNPSILFTLNAKKNLIITETFPALMTFKNNGTATVLDAKLVPKDLAGLTRVSTGSKKLSLEIGDLQPGDSKTFKVSLKAIKTGKFLNEFVVKGRDGVTAKASMETIVTQPKLVLEGSAPGMRYKGNKIRYNLKVLNKGDGEARSLSAVLDIPKTVKFLSATEGGKFDAGASKVVWNLGTLQPGDAKNFSACVTATTITKVPATASVKAFAATPRTKSFLTDVQGIPALLLWVNDQIDPIAVGENETYTINVKNQGSKTAHGVVVECQLEKSMKLISATVNGQKGVLKGNRIVFPPMASLPVGKTATWTVVVKALKDGDVRFKGSVKCKELPSVVSEAESTNFYE